MTNYNWFVATLKKHGYDEKSNISDFWFANKDKVENESFKFSIPEQRDSYSLLIRWKSEIGEVCLQAIKKFIADKQIQNIDFTQKKRDEGDIRYFAYANIDFLEFNFKYHDKEYNLRTFGELFDTSNYFASVDARGIDLSGMVIHNSTLKNVHLSGANLIHADIWQVNLENANLADCNFCNARVASVKIDGSSCLNGNFKNAFVNNVDLTDVSFHGVINEIPYWTLLKKALFGINDRKDRNHTEFIYVNTSEMEHYDLRSYRQYVEWYLKIFSKIREYESDWKGDWKENAKINWQKKLSIIFQIIFSKYWSSYRVFGTVVISLIFLLATIFNFTSSNFKIPDELQPTDFIDGVYFVVVTFATIGYGDISPINHAGQIFVIVTALIGYLCLAIFVFLLSKKIDSN